ncbi:MAG: allantoicase [Gemmatimonadaceae bacterium]
MTDHVNLASAKLGATAIAANDEFFAPKEGLLKPGPAEWHEGEYTERGKWMDGWETRRRREPGHDWCIIKLGAPGTVYGVIVDTKWFTGNFPESCSIDACEAAGSPSGAELAAAAQWREIVPRSKLRGDGENELMVGSRERATHLRLNIFPDGGVARFRAYGVAAPDPWRLDPARGDVDLASAELGGRVEACSDMFYGHRHNMIMPGRATHMGDGWETKRRRGEGNDWSIVRLATPGVIHRVEIDTDHFKGNAPGACSLETCSVPHARDGDGDLSTAVWRELVARTALQPDARHVFFAGDAPSPPVATHARLNIFPDGGIARLRLYGSPAPAP